MARQTAPPPVKEPQKITAGDVGDAGALVKAGPTEVGAAIDFSQYAGLGNENIRTEDKAVPYLVILQKNSPQVDKDHAKYVPGAEVGMILNTVTNEIRKTIHVVNCHFVPSVVEWVPRESGGGFVAEFQPNAPEVLEAAKENLRNDKGKLINRKGNTMVDTARHFVLDLDEEGSFAQAIISMTSTQHKPSRQWNSMIENLLLPRPDGKGKYNPPRFSHIYELTTKMFPKDQFTYYNWVLVGKPVPIDNDNMDLFAAGLAFYQAASKGEVVVGAPPDETGGEGEAEKPGDGRGEKPF